MTARKEAEAIEVTFERCLQLHKAAKEFFDLLLNCSGYHH